MTNLYRFGGDPARPLDLWRSLHDDRRVDATVELRFTLAIVLIGSGAIAAGAVGLSMPARDRLAAAFALLVGAGVGVVTLAIGMHVAGGSPEGDSTVLLTASALGFAATIAGLAVLWRSRSIGG